MKSWNKYLWAPALLLPRLINILFLFGNAKQLFFFLSFFKVCLLDLPWPSSSQSLRTYDHPYLCIIFQLEKWIAHFDSFWLILNYRLILIWPYLQSGIDHHWGIIMFLLGLRQQWYACFKNWVPSISPEQATWLLYFCFLFLWSRVGLHSQVRFMKIKLTLH